MTNWLLPTILLFGGVVGGCSHSQEPEQQSIRIEVALQQMQFMPSEISVHAGDTVVFTNKGIVIHDITEETGKSWTSGPIPAGESFELVVQENVQYYCSLHPIMKGKITVLHP